MLHAPHWTDVAPRYNTAMQFTTLVEETQVIVLNRSLVNLKLRRYDDALSDAESVMQHQASSEKGLFRAARALYELRRYTESVAKLESLIAEHPENSAAQTELTRARRRCHEETSGIYDIDSMYKATNQVPPVLDHATYIGPIKVAKSNQGGRGTFATCDIKAGTLLLCEKAFAYTFGGNKTNLTLLINTHTDKMVMGTMGTLIRDVVQQCARAPSSITKLYDLHREPFRVPESSFVDGIPVVDR